MKNKIMKGDGGMSWEKVKLGDVLFYEQPTKYLVASENYNDEFKVPVLTAGKSFILGYTNETEGIFENLPVIIFDDFTADSKYVDFRFKVKSSAMKILQVNKEKADLRFLFYLMQTLNVDCEQHKRYWISKFAELEIPLPPLSIQKRIAEILDAADALRRKDQELVRKYDELAQAIFIDMFGDPVKNEKGWEVKRLGDLFSEPVKCGPFGSALKKEEYIKNGIPVWVMDNIRNYDFDENGCLFINEKKYNELKSYSATNGDIIISRAGTVGKMSVISSKYVKSIISTNLIKLSLDESRINPYYFIKLMEYFGKKIGRLRTGSENGFTHMNTGVLAGLTFPLPPIEIQLKFIEILLNLKNQSKNLETEPEQLFNSLLQQAFKGELVK